jgi:hypothetical protein
LNVLRRLALKERSDLRPLKRPVKMGALARPTSWPSPRTVLAASAFSYKFINKKY